MHPLSHMHFSNLPFWGLKGFIFFYALFSVNSVNLTLSKYPANNKKNGDWQEMKNGRKWDEQRWFGSFWTTDKKHSFLCVPIFFSYFQNNKTSVVVQMCTSFPKYNVSQLSDAIMGPCQGGENHSPITLYTRHTFCFKSMWILRVIKSGLNLCTVSTEGGTLLLHYQ